jgi:hypothetical protein
MTDKAKFFSGSVAAELINISPAALTRSRE